MALLRRLYGRLRLTVNEAKSAVDQRVLDGKFLGYALWAAPGRVIKLKVADKAAGAVQTPHPPADPPKRRAQHRARGGGTEPLRPGLEGLLPTGANPARFSRKLDQWMRHRLRAIQLKHWKRGATIHQKLIGMGAKPSTAGTVAANSRRWWRNSGMLLHAVLDQKWCDDLGLIRLFSDLNSPNRPVRTRLQGGVAGVRS